jgi:hypothetical protein
MGKDPGRTFEFYEEKGLLPKPKRYRGQEPLYPDNTPWIVKDVLFAHQVEKRTIDDIKRQQDSGTIIDEEIFQQLGLDEPPLNFYYKNVYRGRYQSKDSDILVAIYNNEIIFFLVEGLGRNRQRQLNVLQREIISMEQYGDFVKHQAIRRVTGEGKVLEETYLFETLFG